MTSPLRVIKVICVVLTIAFIFCAFFMISGYFSDDLNYFDSSDNGSGLFVVAVVLGIAALFIILSVAISKIVKEFEAGMFANSEEINSLKKQLDELKKQTTDQQK